MDLPRLRAHTLVTEYVEHLFLQLFKGYFQYIIFIKYVAEEIFLPSITPCRVLAAAFYGGKSCCFPLYVL